MLKNKLYAEISDIFQFNIQNISWQAMGTDAVSEQSASHFFLFKYRYLTPEFGKLGGGGKSCRT